MERIKEHDLVVLLRPSPEHGLAKGDVGAVVHAYDDGRGLEVEFVTGEGATVAVLTLERTDVRLMRKGEILHARELAA